MKQQKGCLKTMCFQTASFSLIYGFSQIKRPGATAACYFFLVQFKYLFKAVQEFIRFLDGKGKRRQ